MPAYQVEDLMMGQLVRRLGPCGPTDKGIMCLQWNRAMVHVTEVGRCYLMRKGPSAYPHVH